MIPQANPGAGFEEFSAEFMAAAERVLKSGCYILGEEVEMFEREFAQWFGEGQKAVGCASGTDALELILRALGAKAGLTVFTVSHSAVATVAAVERAGADVWMVDVENERLTMSPNALEEALDCCRRTRPDLTPWAVMPVHIYGHPADMEAVARSAHSHGLLVLEDCAQSHGALYQGRLTGTLGRAAAFSLYPTKNLGAFGDGGVILTVEAGLAEHMRALRQYGWRERYVSAEKGINTRLDPLQAAFLRLKLKVLERDNHARRRLAAIYDEKLAPLVESGLLKLLPPRGGDAPVYHQYVIRTPERDKLKDFGLKKGVGLAVHYPRPIHLQPAYLNRRAFPLAGNGLPVTEAAAREVLSLPMWPQLGEAEAAYVGEVISEWGKTK